MHTIELDGKEYILRCDLNVIEQIEEKYDTVSGLKEKLGDIAAGKYLIAAMINEHFYYCGDTERVTEDFVGARLDHPRFLKAMEKVLACISDCLVKKK